MKTIYNYIILSLFIGSFLISGCNNEEDLGTAPRLFRPILSCYAGNTSPYISATWEKLPATTYTLEISTDSFATILNSVTIDTTVYVFTNLTWDLNYQLRVKCNGDGIESRYYATSIDLVFPTYLQKFSSSDIMDVAIRTRWSKNDSSYTSIKVFNASDNALVAEVPVTATDTARKYIDIYGLSPTATYKVIAYNNGRYQGYKNVTTVASQIYPVMVDLRSVDDATAVTMLTTSYFQGLQNGSTVILKRGMTYKIVSAVSFDKSVTFVTGLGFEGDASKLAMSGNFNITANASIDSIKFDGVNLIGTAPTAVNFGGYYVFNLNTVSSATNVIFNGCTIKYLRGVCRAQNANAAITNFTINNCIVDSIGGYGIIIVDNVAASVKNIYFTNSTFSNSVYLIRSTKTPTIPLSIIDIENCTFYQAPQSPYYFLDISGTATISDVIVQNCIVGKAMASAATPATYNIYGYRSLNILSFKNSNNYNPNDLTWTFEIPDFNVYTGTSAKLFVSPGKGDFTILDATFSGKATAGDPRWRIK